ncbi:MAG: (2Fe-2S) ferredoxin domain-containing protein [Paludibacter sp.]|nr:(2Fe-2S) ferredoxin domain-containing protein [Paludibacter sp.]MDD4198865.1 (2Fe-2S) ferredoxin domain-containing protein [Paludibacter sp.]MDD4427479.1 (2Fe-2S) ferredoxin domain-containing protein [Paludibacter sp.]
MKRIKSVKDLNKIKEKTTVSSHVVPGSLNDDPVIVKVAMATCGIASGAKDTYDYFVEELKRRNVNAIVCQTGCMSYCYAEPTVEVTMPGEEPVVFGYVNTAKVQEIIDRYIIGHELVDGIIPASYKTV